MTNAIKKVEQTAPALFEHMSGDLGAGFEEADKDSFAIPFLTILQSNSPQCKKSDGAHIKGAEEGMIFNTVSNAIIDGEKGIRFIPTHFMRRLVEWIDRETTGSGGLVGEHLPTDPIANTTTKNAKGRDVLPNGNLLVDTRYHYGLLVTDAGFEPVLITMASTQMKKSRKMMSVLNTLKVQTPDGLKTPPMFGSIFKLTTVPESNEHGAWMGWLIEREGYVEDADLYHAAKEMHAAVKSGAAKPADERVREPGEDDNKVGF